ncbi:MAG: SPOR domain-containing protein [Treponema sp.]|nr:SPOR domain-containing protein [Treponema sp.]
MKRISFILLIALLISLVINSQAIAQVTGFTQRGRATNEMRADGLTIAHPSLPINSRAMVQNTVTGREVEVTIGSRIAASANRIADLSAGVWQALDLNPTTDIRIYTAAAAPRPRPPAPPAEPELLATEEFEVEPEPEQLAENGPPNGGENGAPAEQPLQVTLHSYLNMPEQPPAQVPMPTRAEPANPELNWLAWLSYMTAESRGRDMLMLPFSQQAQPQIHIHNQPPAQQQMQPQMQQNVHPQYVQPAPQVQYIQPVPQVQYVQPVPQVQYVQPQPQVQYVQPTPEPVQVQPAPIQIQVQPTPVEVQQSAPRPPVQVQSPPVNVQVQPAQVEIIQAQPSAPVQVQPPPAQVQVQQPPRAETEFLPPQAAEPPLPVEIQVTITPGLPDPDNGRLYMLQVGSYTSLNAAENVAGMLISVGFRVVLEQAGINYRVLVMDIPSELVYAAAQRLGSLGITNIWVRE